MPWSERLSCLVCAAGNPPLRADIGIATTVPHRKNDYYKYKTIAYNLFDFLARSDQMAALCAIEQRLIICLALPRRRAPTLPQEKTSVPQGNRKTVSKREYSA